jgi:hypothetical protein
MYDVSLCLMYARKLLLLVELVASYMSIKLSFPIMIVLVKNVDVQDGMHYLERSLYVIMVKYTEVP